MKVLVWFPSMGLLSNPAFGQRNEASCFPEKKYFYYFYFTPPPKSLSICYTKPESSTLMTATLPQIIMEPDTSHIWFWKLLYCHCYKTARVHSIWGLKNIANRSYILLNFSLYNSLKTKFEKRECDCPWANCYAKWWQGHFTCFK